jgi:hypothetical protein
MRLPGFVISEFQGLLPAFSSLSGGYDLQVQGSERAFVIGNDQVFPIRQQ